MSRSAVRVCSSALFFLRICRGYADENQGIGARERDAQENLACHVCGGVGDGQDVDEVKEHETNEQSMITTSRVTTNALIPICSLRPLVENGIHPIQVGSREVRVSRRLILRGMRSSANGYRRVLIRVPGQDTVAVKFQEPDERRRRCRRAQREPYPVSHLELPGRLLQESDGMNRRALREHDRVPGPEEGHRE